MASHKLELLAPAWGELEEIARYHLHAVGPLSAKRITEKILDSLERLKEYPLSCPCLPDPELAGQGYRMLVCERYICIHRLIDQTVYVYHIADYTMEYGKLLK